MYGRIFGCYDVLKELLNGHFMQKETYFENGALYQGLFVSCNGLVVRKELTQMCRLFCNSSLRTTVRTDVLMEY
jgi:hypothetical protein